jgi:hypothetical protein
MIILRTGHGPAAPAPLGSAEHGRWRAVLELTRATLASHRGREFAIVFMKTSRKKGLAGAGSRENFGARFLMRLLAPSAETARALRGVGAGDQVLEL